RLGGGDRPALGGIVPGKAGTRPQAGRGGGGDDGAATLLCHDRHHGAGGVIDRLHVDCGDEVENLFLHGQHVAVAMGVAGIVDHDVDAAEAAHGGIDHLVE